jgi:squalene synthase HpnC
MDNPVMGKAVQASATVQHYENFPVASILCPPQLRAPIAAIYWFARTADDLADEGDAPAAQRLADLAFYRADLMAVAAGRAHSGRWSAVFGNLSLALAQHHLPVPLLDDLICAFEQDCTVTRYDTPQDLLTYCRLSANPVGRLLLHLYGVNDDASLAQSDAICSALQLINFWQDLSVDIPRGRIYLPRSLWAAHGVSEGALLARRVDAQTTALVRQACADARALMLQGAPLAKRVPGRAGWELRAVVQGGLRILDKIEGIGFESLRQRVALTRMDSPLLLWRALWM